MCVYMHVCEVTDGWRLRQHQLGQGPRPECNTVFQYKGSELPGEKPMNP